MKIAVHNFYESLSTNNYCFKNANAPIGHNLLLPFVKLYDELNLMNIEILTLDLVDNINEIDLVVFFDRPIPSQIINNILQNKNIKKYLYIMESMIIKPDNWDYDYHKNFDKIFTWLDTIIDNVKYFKYNYNVDLGIDLFNIDERLNSFSELNLCTLIASAKYVNHSNELYSKRIEVINWFENNYPDKLNLYGPNWPQNLKCYKGISNNKFLTLQTAKFSFCYENFEGPDGYITEKILDCLIAGTVPVYWGPKNISSWIDEDIFINAANENNLQNIFNRINSIKIDQYEMTLNKIMNFIKSPKFYPFTTNFFINNFLNSIKSDF